MEEKANPFQEQNKKIHAILKALSRFKAFEPHTAHEASVKAHWIETLEAAFVQASQDLEAKLPAKNGN